MEESLKVIAEEVAMIRKLAVFALQNSGVSQEKIANALGISQATISRQFAPKKPQTQKKTGRSRRR